MFRVEHNVPEVYVQESRDFQLFSRLYDLVLQSSRFSVDSLELASDTQRCNNTLLSLLGSKLGIFEEFTDVPDSVLRLILDAFPHIVKSKGTLKSLALAANVCSRITGGSVQVNNDFVDKYTVYVDFEKPLQYMTVFAALIEYIRPAGCVIRYRLSTNKEYSVDIPDFELTSTFKEPSTWSDTDVSIKTTTDSFKNTVGFTKVSTVMSSVPSQGEET